jgi:hypothetical protein
MLVQLVGGFGRLKNETELNFGVSEVGLEQATRSAVMADD